MKVIQFFAALPSVAVAYLMLCRLNAKKRSILSLEGWAYLLILGGSIFTFYTAASLGILPSHGKILLDCGICLYFAERSIRTVKWQNWHER